MTVELKAMTKFDMLGHTMHWRTDDDGLVATNDHLLVTYRKYPLDDESVGDWRHEVTVLLRLRGPHEIGYGCVDDRFDPVEAFHRAHEQARETRMKYIEALGLKTKEGVVFDVS